MSLYHKYRPKTWEQVVGQDAAVKTLRAKCEKPETAPRAYLLHGPSGVGKTTLARIMARQLGCKKADYQELNCATFESPLDTVRSLQQRIWAAPQTGPCRVWCLDEVQALSRAAHAQQGMLKMLEDGPKHAYFILCTTDPGKVIPTIHTRCLKVSLAAVQPALLQTLLTSVCEQEQVTIDAELAAHIAEVAAGSPRQALVLLDAALAHDNEADRLAAVQNDKVKRDAFELVRLMLWQKGKWPEAAKLLAEIEDDPEGVRRLIRACAGKELLKANGNANNAFLILDVFQAPFFDADGRNSLIRGCYEVFRERSFK